MHPLTILTASRHPAPTSPSHSTQMMMPGGTVPCAKAKSGQKMSGLETALGLHGGEEDIHEGRFKNIYEVKFDTFKVFLNLDNMTLVRSC